MPTVPPSNLQTPDFLVNLSSASWQTVVTIILRAFLATVNLARAADPRGDRPFRQEVEPVLREFCYDCHGEGAHKGGVTLDDLSADPTHPEKRDLWWKALKNVRANLMPPEKKPQPTDAQKQALEAWIKASVFQVDTLNPDPGQVTVRRLNRVEYHNTIQDLLGVDFDTQAEFPPDDSGHGFDNIGDVLTLSPMLMEKYLAAARTIVTKAVPAAAKVPAETVIRGKDFRRSDLGVDRKTNSSVAPTSTPKGGSALTLSYYESASASNRFHVKQDGRYQFVLDFAANERHVENQFDYNKCRFVFKVDGEILFEQEFTRENGRALHLSFERAGSVGDHDLAFELTPLTPDQKQVRSLTMRVDSVTVRGPLEPKFWVRPQNYERFFPKDAPEGQTERREYVRELLTPFVQKAFRRPGDQKTLDRLVALAESTYGQTGKAFEAGVGQAMVAVLASPRFLFREESTEPTPTGKSHPLVDEYALASRLSYFFWASMPDEELFRLAEAHRLRSQLTQQVKRMMADSRFDGFIRNFTGQWLQTRDIESVSIDARQVLAREAAPDPEAEHRSKRFKELGGSGGKSEEKLTPEEKKELAEIRAALGRRFSTPPRAELNSDLRRAMRQETEKVFAYVLTEDHNLLELIESNYTFLNERLAKHYGLTHLDVLGDEIRRVTLPTDSPRGGVLTQGSVLAVTSNPTRTSPVKRGLFVLDNILGTPPPPPPPDIPPLEDASKVIKDHVPTLRETLELHRGKPLCSSCHNRMDPLGLALENFNAMGMFRETERSQTLDVTGKLLSGESFTNVVELKHILVEKHAVEFYRTLTEKMLTYALGRGLEYYDVETVDRVVDRLVKSGGHASVLLAGIIESAPFQKTRRIERTEAFQPVDLNSSQDAAQNTP